MALSVEETLSLSALSGIGVLAGARGLATRFVETVVVIDVPDAHRWIRGGEMLISSGYLFSKNPLELLPLVEGCARSGAAALGIKVGRFLGRLPHEVLSLADSLDFPLLDVPSRINHVDIINPILSALVNRQYEILKKSSTVRDHFLERIAEGGQVQEILDGFESFTGCPVAFADHVRGRRCFSAGMPAHVREQWEDGGEEPLVVAGRAVGSLSFLPGREPLSPLEQAVLAHAKTAIMILAQHNLALLAAESRHRDEFLQELLFRRGVQTPELLARARLVGWRHEGPLLVALLSGGRASGDKAERWPGRTIPVCRPFFSGFVEAALPGALWTDMGSLWALLIPLTAPEESERIVLAVEMIRARVEERTGCRQSAALGSVKRTLAEAGESYAEARETLDILERTHREGRCARWDELGLERVLAGLRGAEEGKRFVRKRLGPLLDAETRYPGRSAELLTTLEALCRNNWNGRNTARDLSVHYNTLKYRMESLRTLLDLDLTDSRNRLELHLALLLHGMDIPYSN